MAHPVCHIEIPTTDFAKSKAFYEALFGWKVQIIPEMNYATWETGERPGGGFNKFSKICQEKECTIVYVLVDSVDETCRRAQTLGGSTVVPKQAVDDMGWFAIIKDTCGAAVGLWEEAKK